MGAHSGLVRFHGVFLAAGRHATFDPTKLSRGHYERCVTASAAVVQDILTFTNNVDT